MMDKTTREALGFPEVLGLLAEWAGSRLGARTIAAMEPAWEFDEVLRRTALMAEALRLEETGGRIPLGGIEDIGLLLERGAVEDSALDAEDWPRIRNHLRLADSLHAFADEREEDSHRLALLCRKLEGDPELAEAIDRIFDEDGLVRDNASPELARLRRSLREAESAVRRALSRILGRLRGGDVLQDDYSTLRNGRHVLPVRAGARGRIQGILHGSSSTGETLYIEPFEVVEPANEVELLREREAREVHRLLRGLTARLRPWTEAGRRNLEVLGRLDAVSAIARCACANGWKLPAAADRGALRLFAAHHPLIHLREQPSSVPINLSLGPADRAIVISGPNAGGKTTCMRTVALATALFQCGCPIPASPDSNLPLVAGIHADIGDAQDLAEGVSTFSGHIRRLNRILRSAGPRAMVLLDELGTGTDPEEGGALAQAALEELLARGVLTIATSHLGPLKAWAQDSAGARNASFSLDPQSRRPSFRLSLDLPGASEAFQIAENEGLPRPLLERARELVGTQKARLGDLLLSIEERERRLGIAVREAEARAESLESQERHASQRAEQLRRERREAREAAARDREAAAGELRGRLERLIAELPGEDQLRRRKEMLLHARDEARAIQSSAHRDIESLAREAGKAVDQDGLAAGSRVYIRPIRAWAEVLQPPDAAGRVPVQVGTMQASVHLQDLSEGPEEEPLAPGRAQPDDDDDEGGAPRRKARRSKRVRAAAKELAAMKESNAPRRAAELPRGVTVRMAEPRRVLPMELDLHGFRVLDALEVLSKYLDDALLADYPYVRIIHGTGEGKLYRAVHRYLKGHRAVEKYRFGTTEEGGGGVTIVEF